MQIVDLPNLFEKLFTKQNFISSIVEYYESLTEEKVKYNVVQSPLWTEKIKQINPIIHIL